MFLRGSTGTVPDPLLRFMDPDPPGSMSDTEQRIPQIRKKYLRN
jgi:hypothetical protein